MHTSKTSIFQKHAGTSQAPLQLITDFLLLKHRLGLCSRIFARSWRSQSTGPASVSRASLHMKPPRLPLLPLFKAGLCDVGLDAPVQAFNKLPALCAAELSSRLAKLSSLLKQRPRITGCESMGRFLRRDDPVQQFKQEAWMSRTSAQSALQICRLPGQRTDLHSGRVGASRHRKANSEEPAVTECSELTPMHLGS